MDAPATPDRRVADAERLVNALGMAWTTFTLYPDPTAQPAFQRTVEALTDSSLAGIKIDIGPAVFLFDQEELSDVRDGAHRLARELFVYDVEHITITGSCTGEGLQAFFQVLQDGAATSQSAEDRSEVVARLAAVAKSGIAVDERTFLVDQERIDEGASDTEDSLEYALDGVAREAYKGMPPEELAAFVVDAGEDDDAVADAFTASFDELYEHLTPVAGQAQAVLGAIDAGDDPWKSVRNLIEAFFYLPRPVQVRVLETVLTNTNDERNQVFLDQFSGLDLAEFLEDLSPEATKALLEYAVASAGTGEGAPNELLTNLQSAKEVQDARKHLSARVADLLKAAGGEGGHTDQDLFDAVGADLREFPDTFDLTRSVLRGLLECEVRQDRFSRILRLWTGRIARAIRDQDYEHAGNLISTVLEEPPYPPEREEDVRGAVRRLAGPELLRRMAEHEEGAEISPEVRKLVELFGPVVVDEFVRQLAVEEDPTIRKTLIELLTISVQSRPRSLEHHLDDGRWYLVRNLVTVLGKTGKSAATAAVRRMLGHDDHRVRIEAMRSLTRLMRADAARFIVPMLADANPRVRSNAAALIKTSESSDIDTLLGRELENDSVHADVATTIVELLAQRETAEARSILEKLAGRKIAVSASARALRDSAKKALKGA